jgi:hypothetical protein
LERHLKLVVSLDGSIISDEGTANFLEASDVLQTYMAEGIRNLENAAGAAIPNTRIVMTPDENDSVMDDPESDEKAWYNDVFYVEITLPPR